MDVQVRKTKKENEALKQEIKNLHKELLNINNKTNEERHRIEFYKKNIMDMKIALHEQTVRIICY